MSETENSAKPRMSTGLRVVFALSLALNLLVITALGGAWLRHGGGEGMSPGGIGRLLYRELPREDRRALRQTLRGSLDRTTLRQARVAPDLVDALRAEPFEADDVRALLARQSSAMKAGQDALRAGWIEIVEGMSREERLDYAERLETALKEARDKRGPKDR